MNSSVVTLPSFCARDHVAQDGEEVVVTDGEPQLVQRHGPAGVDREVEHEVAARVADDDVPEGVVGRDHAVEEVEDLLRGGGALVLLPQPLGVRREALVEPDVLPLAATARLSPYHWCASSWTTTPTFPSGASKKTVE